MPAENRSMLSDSYHQEVNAYDEMLLSSSADSNGSTMRPHWQPLYQTLQQIGPQQLQHKQKEACQFLMENGVNYNVYDDPQGTQRIWSVDIIPQLISGQDWATIERGLIQRGDILNAILEDIYGKRELVRSGLIPAELLYYHPGFHRNCENIQLP